MPAVIWSLYSDLTGDATSSPDPEMVAQLCLALLGEAPDIIYDLCRLNSVCIFFFFFERVAADEE